MLEIDVVCPVYHQPAQIKALLESLHLQEGVMIKRIVCPFTLSGEKAIDDEIRTILIENNVSFFELLEKDFSHSLTRERAIKEYCASDIVVLISQDVVFANEHSLNKLASAIKDDVAYAYGKQICTKRSIEKYIRAKNYGKTSYTIDSSNIDDMQIMAFFASDAFSAINRNIFINLGGYNGYDVMMNEDQLYSKIVLDGGFKKSYVADAVVEHSHKYSLKQLYNRYYETGKFYKQVPLFNSYKSSNTGMKLAFYVLGQAIIRFDFPSLFRWAPDMASRYLGMKKGKK